MNTIHFFTGKMDKKLFSDFVIEINQTKKKIQRKLSSEIPGPYDFIKNVLNKHNENEFEIFQEKSIKPSLIVVVGIGGSNLGAMAIEQALRGIYSNLLKKPQILFADTVDTPLIEQQLLLMRGVLEQKEKVVLIGISKSGKTTESIALFEIFLELLMQFEPQWYADAVIVISEKKSPLALIAEKNKFSFFPIQETIGGRFSIFSAVGLVVFALLGLPLKELLRGAQDAIDASLNRSEDLAAAHAAFIFLHYERGLKIHDLFLFSNQLEMMGKWYRQLMGESIGKNELLTGEQKRVGITPTISIGSTDLHSVGQLYLAGPVDRMTTFVTVRENDAIIAVPHFAEFNSCVPHIQGLPLESIMNAIIEGTQKAYEEQQLPFCTIVLPKISAYHVGQYMQYAMLEIIYLAHLLTVDPFNQPEVELYKLHTRKILAHE